MVLCAARGLLSHFNPASKGAYVTTTTTTKQPLDSSFFFFAFCIFRPTLGTLTDRSKRKIAFTAENSVGKSWNINRLVIVETTGWAFPLCNFCGLIFFVDKFSPSEANFSDGINKITVPSQICLKFGHGRSTACGAQKYWEYSIGSRIIELCKLNFALSHKLYTGVVTLRHVEEKIWNCFGAFDSCWWFVYRHVIANSSVPNKIEWSQRVTENWFTAIRPKKSHNPSMPWNSVHFKHTNRFQIARAGQAKKATCWQTNLQITEVTEVVPFFRRRGVLCHVFCFLSAEELRL